MRKESKKISIIIAMALMLFVGVFVSVKNRNAPATMDDKISVVTSFYPIYFLTAQIGGDLVNVYNLTPAGIEPHDYELTSQDIVKVKKSKMLVLNGGGLEVWSNDLKKIVGINNPKVVLLSDGLINQEMIENGENKKDPHIWLSPSLAVKMSEKIVANLIEIDSGNKEYYQSNFNVLKTELINLDVSYKKELANCGKRSIITAHNAFGYLAKDYGISQISIAGISPEEEPSIQKLAQVAKIAKENEIKYIFFESLSNPKLSQTIAREVGAETLVLNPLESLSKEDIERGKNYFTEMKENLNNLKKALECD